LVLIKKNEEWLWSDEAGSANRSEFLKRIYRMEDITKRIDDRIKETGKRPDAIKELQERLEEYEKKTEGLNKTMPWLSESQKSVMFKLLNDTRVWLSEKIVEQNGKKLYDEVAFTSSLLSFKSKKIKDAYYDLRAIKKPKAEKVKHYNSE